MPAPVNQFTLSALVAGDTWRGIGLIGPITVDGQAPASAIVSARMSFRRDYRDVTPAYVLVTGTPPVGQGQLTVLDAVAWTLTAPAQPLPLPPRVWFWQLEITDATSKVWTMLGGSIEVSPDITY